MPNPGKNETQQDFVSRCIPVVLEDGTAKDQKQAAAICYSKWRERDKEIEEEEPCEAETCDECPEEIKAGCKRTRRDEKAVWTGRYVGTLPDSCFLYVEPGEEKRDGKAYPLSRRHFPYKDASGKIDLAHLRNAIARIPQSNAPGLTPEKKRSLQERARKLLADHGKSLAERISTFLKELLGFAIPADDWEDDAATLSEEAKGVEQEESHASGSRFLIWKSGETWRWLAVFTNRYRDRDNPPEILTDASHRDFEKAVDSGEWPVPELWPWHVPYRIGQTDHVAYDDRGFMLATGTWDDPRYAESLSTRKDLGVSHGMPAKEIRRDKDDPTLIVRYRSREISVLPMDNAANPYTGFLTMEGKTMGLAKEKEDFLRGVVGDERWPDVEAMLSDKAKETEAVEYKAEETTGTVTFSAETTATDQAVVVEAEVKAVTAPPGITREEVADELAHITNAFVEQFGKMIEQIAGLKSAVKELQEAAAEREKELESLTPAASLHSMVQSRVIGARDTRVRADSPLASAGPAVLKDAASGPTPVGLINALASKR